MSTLSFGMEGPRPIISDSTESIMKSGAEAIRDALTHAMELDESVIIVGEGVTDAGAIFGTTRGLLERFGAERVIESPLSENAMTGVCLGAAIAGLRPVMIHQRIDFLLLAADQIINHAAKWRYMHAGKIQVPLVIRAIVGKGWGQAAQHSQSLQAVFAHIPGLRVVMPSSGSDAKGLLLEAIAGNDPVLFIETREFHNQKDIVPSGEFRIPFGCARKLRTGTQGTLIGIGAMSPLLKAVAESLAEEIDLEVIDVRSVSPLDKNSLIESVNRTRRALVADTGHLSFGVSAEISALLHENCFERLNEPVIRIALPDVPTPCSYALEKIYYPTADSIKETVRRRWLYAHAEINLERQRSRHLP